MNKKQKRKEDVGLVEYVFCRTPSAEYLEKLVQLCRSMDKNKKKGSKVKND